MSESGWTPEGWEDRGPAAPERLPRIEDLPLADQGYDRAAVQHAFDAFYLHAAQLDATLRVLESMEAFARQAGDLRADIRALRAASWGPAPTARPAWRPREDERAYARGGAAGAAVPRLALEAAFIVLVAVGAAAADLPRPLIVALVLASWLLVGISEFVASTRRASLRPALHAPPPAPAARAEAAPAAEPYVGEPTMIEPAPLFVEDEQAEPAAEAEPEPVVGPEPFGEPAREPEPEPAVEPMPEPLSEPEPEPEVAAAVAPPAGRRWFRRRRAEELVEPPAPQPSGHVRVVAAPEAVAAGVDVDVEEPGELAPEPGPAAEPEASPEPVADEHEVAVVAEPEPQVDESAVDVEPEPEAVEEPEPVAESDEVAAELDPEPGEPPAVEEPEPVAESDEVAAETEPEPEEPPVVEEPEPVAESHEVAAELEPEPGEPPAVEAPEPVAESDEVAAALPSDDPEPREVEPDEAEPDVWPEHAAAAAAAPEPPPADEQPRRSWFRRRAVPPPPPPAAPAPLQRIEVERAIFPEEASVPWDVPAAGAASADPWEQGPEPFGVALDAADEPEPAPAAAPPPLVQPEGHPQPDRLRRGRR